MTTVIKRASEKDEQKSTKIKRKLLCQVNAPTNDVNPRLESVNERFRFTK